MTQTLTPHVTAQLRAEMGRQDINRAELARRLGVTEVFVGRRLNGVTAITLDDLELFVRALGITVESLFTGAPALS